MKLLLKLILASCFVLVGIYAATPLWLPHIITSQLPAGWQLEDLQSGYPGPSGINIDQLRISGETGLAHMELESSGIRFFYRDHKTDITRVSLDVQLYDDPEKPSAESSILDDLALPVTKITGNLPRLSITDMRVTLHRVSGPHDEAFRPIRLGFESLELNPRSDQAYHLTSRMTMTDSPQLRSRLDVDVSPELTRALFHLSTNVGTPPWLSLEIEQLSPEEKTITRLKAVLDSELVNHEWLDFILAGGTRQAITQLDGKLEMEAEFSGSERQDIATMKLATENLHLVSDTGTLDLGTELSANREGDDIVIELLSPTRIQYRGRTGQIEDLAGRIIPGLQLTQDPDTKIESELGAGSRFSYRFANEPAIGFSGDLRFEVTSTIENLTLRSNGIRIHADDLNRQGSTTAEGVITFAWQRDAPLSYTSEDTRLEADGLSLSGELNTREGRLVSTGSGTIKRAHMTTNNVFAEEIELTWRELDPIGLTGQLATITHGFSAEFDDQTWTGFDLDINYTLPGKNDVEGAGNVIFNNGQAFPLDFTGNVTTRRWDISLLPVTIMSSKLRPLLSAAHYQLPDSIRLTGGFIELQGDVLVDDGITADILVSGHEMGASLMESRARKAGFSFKSGFDRIPWATGPVTIEAITLAGGVEVSQFRAELELEGTERYGLKNISADIFDGQLKLGSLRFSEDTLEDTTIEFSHINLGRLLAYADIDGLKGSGFLDISLPVGVDQKGPHVKDGSFTSSGPGRIAYTKAGVAESNIGLQALKNFEYKDLSGTLNYQSDGNYVIAIRLEGKNPDLYGGHPVVFNLNVNGLLPEFFEAMLMTGSFEESILKQIKSQ